MARLYVQYLMGDAKVTVDGVVRGDANRVLRIEPGRHMIALENLTTDPAKREVFIASDADPEDVISIGFGMESQPVDRLSPLYCRYGAYMLGLFLLYSIEDAKGQYANHRGRMLEFLRDIDVDVELPDKPLDPEAGELVTVIQDLTPKLGQRSSELLAFFWLGIFITGYEQLSQFHPSTAARFAKRAENVRIEFQLPEIELHTADGDDRASTPVEVISRSLKYLRDAIDGLELEEDTAFVIMPFGPPHDGYYSSFYRPALEAAGYRAFRAWGDLRSEDYCDLLLKLIEKSGAVLADVSNVNPNVFYEIGAAHALDKLSFLIVAEDDASVLPANIGHDPVLSYSPTASDWPEIAVADLRLHIAMKKVAWQMGESVRVKAGPLSEAADAVRSFIMERAIPPEAHQALEIAAQSGREGNFGRAERFYSDAIQFGLDGATEMIMRGITRWNLQNYEGAEEDLTAGLERAEENDMKELCSTAAFSLGVIRELDRDDSAALIHYDKAVELGYPKADVFRRRAAVKIALGRVTDAESDVRRAREMAPQDPETVRVEADLLTALTEYDDAIATYDRALALNIQPRAPVEFARAFVSLLAGNVEDAVQGYRAGLTTAAKDETRIALDALDREAADDPGTRECRALLLSKIEQDAKDALDKEGK